MFSLCAWISQRWLPQSEAKVRSLRSGEARVPMTTIGIAQCQWARQSKRRRALIRRRPPSKDFDQRVVADQEAERLRQSFAAGQLHVAAEQAALHPRAEVLDRGVGEDDRVLDLAAANLDLGADRGVGADEGVFDRRAG